MEQDVDTGFRAMCSTCLSSDRNLISINGLSQVYQLFRLLMYDFAGERFGDTLSDVQQLVCWECLALLKRFAKFKRQVHNAQEHLRVLAMSQSQESLDHTYMSQSLSALEFMSKTDYDKIYFDYTASEAAEWPTQYITIAQDEEVKDEDFSVVQSVHNNISLDMDSHILEVPGLLDGQVTGIMSHIVVSTDDLVNSSDYSQAIKGELPELNLSSIPAQQIETVIMCENKTSNLPDEGNHFSAYVSEYLSESDMRASREEAKQKVHYASSTYKCELCIIGFYNQQQVEDHFVSAHRGKPGTDACKVCYVYIDQAKLQDHMDTHYLRHTCKLCGHVEVSIRLIKLHVKTHLTKQQPNNVIKIGDVRSVRKNHKKKSKESVPDISAPKPGDLRKLLSKTTIEGYQCLECDMFFKSSRARKNHVARYHREGLQCDHCKKRFVNRTTLATHLRLHEGPLPRKECPICHKMVRVIQLKYHIQRHENKSRYECSDCNKVFSHMATYQAHLKFSRAHASDQVFKFPCPMCNKGYPTKEAMQDHFNYQHLGKTAHKCPVCDKPIASKVNVEKHMMRVHGEKKEKPRNHTCQQCGKSFTDKKALTQHEVIHSAERPLSCDLCHQTFRQKASLYTHRKRVHKVFPHKKVVEFMDKSDSQ